ncbi:MAG TPA: hypothetical protein VJH23_05075 [archaeon]|nr:hypothetical protein [archaeon]
MKTTPGDEKKAANILARLFHKMEVLPEEMHFLKEIDGSYSMRAIPLAMKEIEKMKDSPMTFGDIAVFENIIRSGKFLHVSARRRFAGIPEVERITGIRSAPMVQPEKLRETVPQKRISPSVSIPLISHKPESMPFWKKFIPFGRRPK